MLILFTRLTKRVIAASQLSPLLQKGEDEVEYVLRRLTAEPVAMLEPTRETVRRSHPNYRLREHVITALGPAVTYRRRTSDEYDRKILQLLRETGTVNARLVRSALDIGAVVASRVLADLVERGLLVKTSDAQRGPSVTYGPGPQLPDPPVRGRQRAQKPKSADAVDGQGKIGAADEGPPRLPR